jgi:hypothetical protein
LTTSSYDLHRTCWRLHTGRDREPRKNWAKQAKKRMGETEWFERKGRRGPRVGGVGGSGEGREGGGKGMTGWSRRSMQVGCAAGLQKGLYYIYKPYIIYIIIYIIIYPN